MSHQGESEGVKKALETLILDYHELNPSTIEELTEEPTPLEFMRYVAKNKPFVIRKGATTWQACEKWDAEYLKQAVGDSPVKLAVTPLG
jgi:peptidyl-lysine (3S)-dioxygenase / protease